MSNQQRRRYRYDARAVNPNYYEPAKRVVRIGNLTDEVESDASFKDLSDNDLIQQWDWYQSQLQWVAETEAREELTEAMQRTEAEWESRYPGIKISNPEPPPLTVNEVMDETGLTRSAANRRLRLGLPRDLLLAPAGKLPRKEHTVPEVERAHKGTVLRKYHLYQIAQAATDLFVSNDATHSKLIKLRDALEAAGISLDNDSSSASDAYQWPDMVDSGYENEPHNTRSPMQLSDAAIFDSYVDCGFDCGEL